VKQWAHIRSYVIRDEHLFLALMADGGIYEFEPVTGLRDWQLAGVWDLIHFALLDWLARSDQIDWSRTVLDSCSVRAVSCPSPCA
jgi:hypothetical protein